MNEFNVNRKSVQKGNLHKQKKNTWTGKMLLVMIFAISCIFGTFVMRVRLMDKIEKLSAEGYKIQSMINQKELEIQSLKNQKARLCSWENVSRKINEHHLALQKRSPEQIRYMNRYDFDSMRYEAVLTMDDDSGEETAGISVNTDVASIEYRSNYGHLF